MRVSLDRPSRFTWRVIRRPPAVALVGLTIGLLPGLAITPRVLAGPAQPVGFDREVRAILSENCYQCHGPDRNQRKADLRLDVRADAVRSEAILPGRPDESELIARIFSDDPEEVMPPPKSRKRLTDAQKETLRRWVAEGAVYQRHWAYEPPVKPEAPAGANGLDTLVERHLARKGLHPSPAAERRVLARRLHFDLVGLPPAPEVVESFVNDPAPDAYEKLVDRLLASPRYGERMAIDWLDVVRFADTIGYHSDTPRNVWPYRDYVIRAFNTNMPFDRFTIEQLAGDLLPSPTQDQKVASCFNRLLLTTEEGGAQAKDYEARMLGDRVRAVGTVWLGQTLGCCQCHDHKYDPATARDFYSLGAFFADIEEPIIGKREPGMIVTDERLARERERHLADVDRLRQQVAAADPAVNAGQRAWEQTVLAEQQIADRWVVLHPDEATAEQGARLAVDPDGTITASRNSRAGIDTYRVKVTTTLRGITGFRLDALVPPAGSSQGPGRAPNGNFVLTEVVLTQGANTSVALSHASATFEQSGFPASSTIDGKTDKQNGWAILGSHGTDQAIVFETAAPLGDGPPLQLTITLRQSHGDSHTLGRFRLQATTAAAPVRAPRTVIPDRKIAGLIAIDPASRSVAQRDELARYYRRFAPELNPLRARLESAEAALAAFEASLPRCMVSTALVKPRPVRILPRGNWLDDSGDLVQPAFPSYLSGHSKTDSQRLTRLDLARWLVARENPLTARVLVNRLWKQFFGMGLSKTVDDLGSQGERPENPELLDWLACEFMDSGWDVKQVVRTIVTSHTYRQSSSATKEQLARDPDNRDLARQSRFRLAAELVRDNALSIAGLLADEIGGPSVRPYQPDGYWENLNFPPRQYVADQGESQYRRGLYTWWQRSFPHPSMIAFDAPSREECAADRGRSNIPQQALVMLNDPTYVEAARAFATQVLQRGGSDDEARIAWAWRQALQRPPRDDEATTVRTLLHRHRAHYERDAQDAEALLKVGQTAPPAGIDKAELAAWTSVARVILNLHETITRN